MDLLCCYCNIFYLVLELWALWLCFLSHIWQRKIKKYIRNFFLACCYLLPSWIWVDNKWWDINHQENNWPIVTTLLISNIYIFLLHHPNIHFIQCWEPYNSIFKLWVNVMGPGLLISHFMHFREVSWLYHFTYCHPKYSFPRTPSLPPGQIHLSGLAISLKPWRIHGTSP